MGLEDDLAAKREELHGDEKKHQKIVQRRRELGHHVAARKARERLDLIREKLRAVIQRLVRLRKRKDTPQVGEGAWGGSQSVIEEIVFPVVPDSIPLTSTKRTETYGNPTSDHHVSQTTAYAADFGTANNYGLADEIGKALGIGPVDDYALYYRSFGGHTFRIQIIAGTHGTGPHLHVGVRRV